MVPPSAGTGLNVKLVLDTHSAGLDGLVFGEVVALRKPDGTDIVPVAVEPAEGSGNALGERDAVRRVGYPLTRPEAIDPRDVSRGGRSRPERNVKEGAR